MINVRKKTPTGTTGLLVLSYGKFSDSVSVGGTQAGWERISGESLLLLLMLLSEQQVKGFLFRIPFEVFYSVHILT